MGKPSVYIASKMRYAKYLQEVYVARPDIHFTNRWIFLESIVPDSPKHAANFWVDDIADVLLEQANAD